MADEDGRQRQESGNRPRTPASLCQPIPADGADGCIDDVDAAWVFDDNEGLSSSDLHRLLNGPDPMFTASPASQRQPSPQPPTQRRVVVEQLAQLYSANASPTHAADASFSAQLLDSGEGDAESSLGAASSAAACLMGDWHLPDDLDVESVARSLLEDAIRDEINYASDDEAVAGDEDVMPPPPPPPPPEPISAAADADADSDRPTAAVDMQAMPPPSDEVATDTDDVQVAPAEDTAAMAVQVEEAPAAALEAAVDVERRTTVSPPPSAEHDYVQPTDAPTDSFESAATEGAGGKPLESELAEVPPKPVLTAANDSQDSDDVPLAVVAQRLPTPPADADADVPNMSNPIAEKEKLTKPCCVVLKRLTLADLKKWKVKDRTLWAAPANQAGSSRRNLHDADLTARDLCAELADTCSTSARQAVRPPRIAAKRVVDEEMPAEAPKSKTVKVERRKPPPILRALTPLSTASNAQPVGLPPSPPFVQRSRSPLRPSAPPPTAAAAAAAAAKNDRCVMCRRTFGNDGKSAYCSFACIDQQVAKAVQVLRESQEPVVVVDKRTGRALGVPIAPPLSKLKEWLYDNPMYYPLLPNRPAKRSSAEKTEADSSTGGAAEAKSLRPDVIRLNVRRALKEVLCARAKSADDMMLSANEIRDIAIRIEEVMFRFCRSQTSVKYKQWFKALLLNLKNLSNKGLFRRILTNELTTARLVTLSADELSSDEFSSLPAAVPSLTSPTKIKDVESYVRAKEAKADGGLDSVLGLIRDTTAEHKSHLFDLNCRVCNRRAPDGKHVSSKKSDSSQTDVKAARVPLALPPAAIQLWALQRGPHTPPGSPGDIDSQARARLLDAADRAPVVSSSLWQTKDPEVWSGRVVMPGYFAFDTTMLAVGGAAGFKLAPELPATLEVVGRIPPSIVWNYLSGRPPATDLILLRLEMPSQSEDRAQYDKMFDNMKTKGRFAVVGKLCKAVKDFYLVPYGAGDILPDWFKSLEGPGIDANHGNIIVCFVVRYCDPEPARPAPVPLPTPPTQPPLQQRPTRQPLLMPERQPERAYDPADFYGDEPHDGLMVDFDDAASVGSPDTPAHSPTQMLVRPSANSARDDESVSRIRDVVYGGVGLGNQSFAPQQWPLIGARPTPEWPPPPQEIEPPSSRDVDGTPVFGNQQSAPQPMDLDSAAHSPSPAALPPPPENLLQPSVGDLLVHIHTGSDPAEIASQVQVFLEENDLTEQEQELVLKALHSKVDVERSKRAANNECMTEPPAVICPPPVDVTPLLVPPPPPPPAPPFALPAHAEPRSFAAVMKEMCFDNAEPSYDEQPIPDDAPYAHVDLEQRRRQDRQWQRRSQPQSTRQQYAQGDFEDGEIDDAGDQYNNEGSGWDQGGDGWGQGDDWQQQQHGGDWNDSQGDWAHGGGEEEEDWGEGEANWGHGKDRWTDERQNESWGESHEQWIGDAPVLAQQSNHVRWERRPPKKKKPLINAAGLPPQLGAGTSAPVPPHLQPPAPPFGPMAAMPGAPPFQLPAPPFPGAPPKPNSDMPPEVWAAERIPPRVGDFGWDPYASSACPGGVPAPPQPPRCPPQFMPRAPWPPPYGFDQPPEFGDFGGPPRFGPPFGRFPRPPRFRGGRPPRW